MSVISGWAIFSTITSGGTMETQEQGLWRYKSILGWAFLTENLLKIVRPKNAISSLPSPLKSPTATPSAKMLLSEVATLVNVPSPLPGDCRA